MAFWPVLFTVGATVLLALRFGFAGLVPAMLLPWWIYRARRLVECSQWAITDRVLLWRSGWFDRHLSFAEIGKLQALQLRQSPFDRRRGMASLIADTAGASPWGHRLELRHLTESDARTLYARIGRQLARSGLRW
jgi:putative membrane protein